MSWLSKAVHKVGSGVKSVGRAVDPTSSKSLVRAAGRAVDVTDSRSAIRKAPAAVSHAVTKVTHIDALDPTSRTSLVGKHIPEGVREAIREGAATAAVGMTGGAALLLGKRVSEPAKKGYAKGAAVELAVLGGKSLGTALGGAARDSLASGGGSGGGGDAVPVTDTTAPVGESFFSRLVKLAFPGA